MYILAQAFAMSDPNAIPIELYHNAIVQRNRLRTKVDALQLENAQLRSMLKQNAPAAERKCKSHGSRDTTRQRWEPSAKRARHDVF